MSRTRADLRFKALSIILGGDAGQQPSDEDATALDGYIDDVIAELSAKSIVTVSDPDDIDDAVFGNLAALVANAAADEFGGKMDPTKQAAAERNLRVIVRPQAAFGPQITEYF